MKARRWAWISLAMAVLMLAVLVLFTYPIMSSTRLLFMGDIATSDITELNFPARHLLSTYLENGRLPIWDPNIGCGFPLLAEGQAGLLYPLNLILFRVFSPTLAFNLSVIISLLLSLVFSYLLSRAYGLSRPSSLYAAVAFTFSGFIISKLKFTYMVNSIAWFPLAIYGLEKTFLSRNVKYLLLTTLALSMQLLAGGPQIFFITTLLIFVVLIWRLILWRKKTGIGSTSSYAKPATRIVAIFIVFIVLSLALAAPQLVPQITGYPFFNRSSGMSFETSLSMPMMPKSLALFFSPYQHGNPARGTFSLERQLFWEDIAYPGLLTLVLSLVALCFLVKRDSDVLLWLSISVFGVLIALGGSTPLARFLWKYVPGFGMFRFYQRFMLITVMGISVMAGKGLDHILKQYGGKAFKAGIVTLCLVVLITDLGLFAHSQISTIETGKMLERGSTVQFLNNNLGAEEPYRYSTLGETIAWKKAYAQANGWLGDKEPYYSYYDFLPPNFNDNFELPGAQQYGAYGVTPIKELWGLTYYGSTYEKKGVNILPQSVLSALAIQSVKFIVTPYELEGTGLQLIDTRDTGIQGLALHIYELESALPRTFIATNYEVVENTDSLTLAQIDELLSPISKVGERVVLEREPEPIFDVCAEDAGTSRIIASSADRVVIEAEAPRGGILVLSDTCYPEWHAYVDGNEVEILKANIAFRGISLEPGRHTIEFVFRPFSFYYGIAIGSLGLVLLLFILFFGHRTRWFKFPDLT